MFSLIPGDTVYVLRDIVNEESQTTPKEKHTYKTIKDWKYSDCDIFRIERLWKDERYISKIVCYFIV